VQVKIGDFGFTKRLSGNKASMQVKRITHPRWVAPEVRARGALMKVCMYKICSVLP
jgi:hypothetical protein